MTVPNHGLASQMRKIFRPAAPFYVQFEVTDACNHQCFFCYNHATKMRGRELSTEEAKNILLQMREAGVFSVNFNGGEPLMRHDIFELASYAKTLGFDIHMNTNATLVDSEKADRISALFPSVCTSVLAASPEKHDRLVGIPGAWQRMRRGVDLLTERGVNVEINVCTTRENFSELYDIASSMAAEGVHVFCATRYIMVTPEGRDLLLGKDETIAVLDALELISRTLPTYKEVKLPGPVPYCELPSEYKSRLDRWNTPCQVGYGVCRVSPYGTITPCPLSSKVMGELRQSSFQDIWHSEHWELFSDCRHLPSACRTCEDLEACRGGCIGYDDCLVAQGETPQTRKWSN